MAGRRPAAACLPHRFFLLHLGLPVIRRKLRRQPGLFYLGLLSLLRSSKVSPMQRMTLTPASWHFATWAFVLVGKPGTTFARKKMSNVPSGFLLCNISVRLAVLRSPLRVPDEGPGDVLGFVDISTVPCTSYFITFRMLRAGDAYRTPRRTISSKTDSLRTSMARYLAGWSQSTHLSYEFQLQGSTHSSVFRQSLA